MSAFRSVAVAFADVAAAIVNIIDTMMRRDKAFILLSLFAALFRERLWCELLTAGLLTCLLV